MYGWDQDQGDRSACKHLGILDCGKFLVCTVSGISSLVNLA